MANSIRSFMKYHVKKDLMFGPRIKKICLWYVFSKINGQWEDDFEPTRIQLENNLEFVLLEISR